MSVVCQKLRLINYAEKFMQAQAGGRWCHWVIVLVWAPFINALLAVSPRKLIHSFLELGFEIDHNVYKRLFMGTFPKRKMFANTVV